MGCQKSADMASPAGERGSPHRACEGWLRWGAGHRRSGHGERFDEVGDGEVAGGVACGTARPAPWQQLRLAAAESAFDAGHGPASRVRIRVKKSAKGARRLENISPSGR